jgi:general secretion pathway protein K
MTPGCPGPPRRPGDRRGFALIIVLWTLVLLGLLVGHLTATGRSEARIAQNYAANAAAEADADGAVYEAAFRVINGDWGTEGRLRELQLGRGVVRMTVLSDAGKINPNIASPDLLASLLRVLGVEGDQANALASAIADWREPGDQPRPDGAKAPQYRAAGLDYGPPNSSFESLDEIGRVLGMTPALLAALRPHLTLYEYTDPDPALADPVVIQALRQLPNQSGQPSVPPALANGQQTMTITAEAHSDNGGIFTRHAVIRIGPAFERGYQILAWDGRGGE